MAPAARTPRPAMMVRIIVPGVHRQVQRAPHPHVLQSGPRWVLMAT